MSLQSDAMELREDDIRAHYPAALAMVQGFDHAPRIGTGQAAPQAERSSGVGTRRAFRSTTPGLVTKRIERTGSVSLEESIAAVEEDDPLPTALEASALQAVRRAIAIAEAVAEQVGGMNGLTELKRKNLEGALPEADRQRFGALLQAEALTVAQVFANALSALLADFSGEITQDVGEVDEFLTDNGQLMLHGLLWELNEDIQTFADDDARLIATLTAFSEQVMQKAQARAQSTGGLEAFTQNSWRIEADDLTIRGFEPSRATKGSTLTMVFKKPNEVVGNHIAKYQALKLSKMIMAYDFERKLNPFVDLGGFIFTFMGDGAPGTGKTTLIQMMAGLINGYCQNAGYPFRYQNFGIDNIDSYQGKSGQNAKAFINNVMDPGVIGFGTIDDIDQIAGKRGDRQSSAGQQEVTAVLMESFAGANTVVRGNCTFGMFSNYPENVDDALRQRAGARFLVDGPQSRDDYIDILTLLLGKNHNIPLGEHDLYEAQHIQKAVSKSYESYNQPHEEGLTRVYAEVEAQTGPMDTLAKMGTYLKAIHAADERFTGRAIKNITDAVKVRAMDFELPDAWMEEPELFLWKDYETKRAMIEEMRIPITPEMVMQEINRYADSEFRYADKSDEVAIDTMVRDMERSQEAKKRFLEGQG